MVRVMQDKSVETKFHLPELTDHQYKMINHILSFLLIFLSAYIMFMPFIPEVTAYYNGATDSTKGYKYASRLAKQEGENIDFDALKPIPDYNALVIPKIGVDSPIVEGAGPEALNSGLWRRPHTSTPDKGGNTVITGHRFLYTSGPTTFYNLDKLKVGDKFFMYWKGKEYDYEVTETLIVPATAVEIEQNTDETMLTLYTCHPLWTSKDRLVVRAKLIN